MSKKRNFSKESPTVEQKSEPVKRQTLTEWITDLCRVKECRDGFVSKEIQGYSTLFACPGCDRYKRDLHPFQAIPTAKKWMGPVEYYTDDEMDTRRKERQERVEQLRARSARSLDWQGMAEQVGLPI